jgi:hypothetical protein
VDFEEKRQEWMGLVEEIDSPQINTGMATKVKKETNRANSTSRSDLIIGNGSAPTTSSLRPLR